MRILTFAIALIHLVYIVSIMWLGPFLLYKGVANQPCRLTYYTIAWSIMIFLQIAHWAIPSMKNECIVSYWEKKAEDPTYIKGTRPTETYAWVILQNMLGNSVTISQIREFHMVMTKVACLFAVVLLTLKNKCFIKNNNHRVIAYAIMTAFTSKYVCLDSAVNRGIIK